MVTSAQEKWRKGQLSVFTFIKYLGTKIFPKFWKTVNKICVLQIMDKKMQERQRKLLKSLLFGKHRLRFLPRNGISSSF